MQQIKVSIIIAVYNSQKYLEQCLKSCINQTLDGIEIICINDGSKDSSLEILDKYAQKYPQIKIINKQNQGQGAARNDGLKIAQGEYITFVDSDDWLELNALEILYNKMKQDESDIIIYNFKYFFDDNKSEEYRDFVEPYTQRFKERSFTPDEGADVIFQTNPLPIKMYKRRLWIDNNIEFTSHKVCEDSVPYFLTLINAKRISTEQKFLYHYRKYDGSTSMTKSYSEELFEIFYQCEKLINDSPCGKKVLSSFITNRIEQISGCWSRCVNENERAQFYKKMRETFKYILNKYGIEYINSCNSGDFALDVIKMPYFIYTIYKRLALSLFAIRLQFI